MTKISDHRQRTSDGGNGITVYRCLKLDKNQSRSNASIFMHKLAVGLYFMILHSISYFHKCTALFWGQTGHFFVLYIEKYF